MAETKLFTMKEFCSYLGIGRNTALTLLQEKRVNGFKAGKHWLIPYDEIQNYIQNEMNKQPAKNGTKKDKKTK